MTHFVYYKFRSTIEFEKLTIESRQISLGDFKNLVSEHKNIAKNANVKLEVKNATSDHIYKEDNEMISENSTLILRRVPINFKIGSNEIQKVNIAVQSMNGTNFQTLTEEEKMRNIMDQNKSVIDYEQTQTEMMRKLQKTGKVPVCYHCKAVGHVYRTCPLLTQQSQVKRDEPTHIFLKSQLGLLPLQPHNYDNTQRMDLNNLGGSSLIHNIPDYLKCPICKNLMEKAVLASCCGTSYCDICIQDYLFHNDFKCFECKEYCSPESIISNLSLRKSILTFSGVDINKNTTSLYYKMIYINYR